MEQDYYRIPILATANLHLCHSAENSSCGRKKVHDHSGVCDCMSVSAAVLFSHLTVLFR